ncbi:hypothetical protein SCLCIDRAFT_1212797 [Scleroderma citrinum Foug A]|uniref:Uncharacterized protein n=1 Tax=Scleroderma citrinum Foug A TaxID=1036808 RepID=A0A0C3E9T0_9AGAM|nr:hypothetical protein SCLCIDRAFT_1212797 [Scleroderma citrinum Foug A]
MDTRYLAYIHASEAKLAIWLSDGQVDQSEWVTPDNNERLCSSEEDKRDEILCRENELGDQLAKKESPSAAAEKLVKEQGFLCRR